MPVKPTRRRRWWLMFLFMLVVDAVLVGLAEGSARWFGPEFHHEVVRKERLDRPPPSGTRRVFIFGESTIYGFPYGPENSTARWLEVVLQAVLPGEKVQVVSFGRPARGSFHLQEAVKDTLRLRPDAVILCLGHNEFLPRSLAFVQNPWHTWSYFHVHLYRHAYDGMARLRQKSLEKHGLTADTRNGFPPWSPLYRDIVAGYRDNLAHMLTRCQQAGIPAVVCAPACNFNWPPQHPGVHRPSVAQDELGQFNGLMETARRQLRLGQPATATLAQAAALSPDNPELHYWTGRDGLLRGEAAQAKVEFQKALDHDGWPFRCQSPLVAAARELALGFQVPFVDLPAEFAQHAGPAGTDMAWFIDACHPRPAGQLVMAQAMARALQSRQWPSATAAWHWDAAPRLATAVQALRVTTAEWRAPERTALLALLADHPQTALDLAESPPPVGAASDDLEWRMFRVVSLQACGRTKDAAHAAATLAGNGGCAGVVAGWPDPVRELWRAASMTTIH